ncbi:LysE family translocator [Burkholderia pyrrocinia]|uniref:LysE family translocator n=1 Tax=Burkholderia pyrrocinia TaxID=60550 RepID=UPI001046E8AD|nr:LysE family translocator [Burkholderia pyrrocinia]TDA46834.1 LysE family translocator [Burkholderia pyrrocinia]
MPTLQVMLKMALYVSLVLATPGPTNTLLLSSGIKVGFRQSSPLLVAEALGYGFAISLWGFFLATFAATRPWLYDVLKLGSSAYICYLALQLWKSPRFEDIQSDAIGFRDMFVATTMNPKALLFATAIFPPQAFVSVPFYLCSIAVFTALAVTIGSMWLTIGGVLTARRSLATHTGTLLRGASVVLLMFAGTLAFSVLNR